MKIAIKNHDETDKYFVEPPLKRLKISHDELISFICDVSSDSSDHEK